VEGERRRGGRERDLKAGEGEGFGGRRGRGIWRQERGIWRQERERDLEAGEGEGFGGRRRRGIRRRGIWRRGEGGEWVSRNGFDY
jgi:hypothetical protein